MATTPQKNSFVTIAEQISLLNANATKLVASLNDIVTSDNSIVNVTQTDSYGKTYTYTMPTVGKLQADITELNNNIKRLAGLNDNNVHIINGKSTKKIYLSDLNREPNRIESIDTVTNFTQTNNWFFESLINPTLSIKFDMTDKVGSDVDGIISRRYIVKFEKSGSTYTTLGETARQDFINNFVNKKNINLKDFISWHTNSTNVGVINNTTPTYDEQSFDFDYQEVSDYGVFSVEKQETDTINNKLWYHIYPYKYVSSTGGEKTLKVGDELILNKQDSVTRYSIIETSISSSNFRVRLERIEGFEPVPTGVNTLKYYGSTIVNKVVNITVGFDEYLVVFMKPYNSRNKIKGSLWSQGTGIYTNDLILDTDNNISLSQYYLNSVSDYGVLIKDLINKSIPTPYGVTPNAPVLISDNFKVVQINKHLTDTEDVKVLNDLHTQKNTLKTKLEQINNAIIQKNQDLAIKKYASISEKEKDSTELSRLVKEQQTYTSNYNSITTQIKSKTDTINNIEPKFRIRGFWDFPAPQSVAGYRNQEVIQFKVQYRYSAKNGTENQTQGYELTTTDGATKTGYFSNWNQYVTIIRSRTYNQETNTWTWDSENVSDADAPNINQLDINLEDGEKAEIRIKSISEVGFPDSIIESEWSNIITIEFPDSLSSTINANEYVLKQAEQDNLTTEFEMTLETKGVNKHVQDSYTINNKYIAHADDKVITNYKDLQGNTYNLREYLDYLTNKITTLENVIYSAKGILRVSVFDGKNETEIKNNSETFLSVILQNYGITKNNIDYNNKISRISDFYLKIENLSSASNLKFLVSDSYSSNTIIRHNDNDNLVSLVDINNNIISQVDNQFIYFCDTYKNVDLYDGGVTSLSGTTGDNGYLINAITSTDKNIGVSSGYTNGTLNGNSPYPITGKVLSGTTTNEWYYNNSGGTMATTIAPQVNTINYLIPTNGATVEISNSDDIIIPLNIYWLFKTVTDTTVNLTNENLIEHTKSLRVRLNPTSISGIFEFVITFNIQNKKI